MTRAILRIARILSLASAIVLALSFAFPLARQTTFVGADGQPLGFWGQFFSARDAPSIVDYEFFWDQGSWSVLLVFFLPLVLVLTTPRAPRRVRPALEVLAPVVAGFLFAMLLAMVNMSDFGINLDRMFGGYVALGALGVFVVASAGLALPACVRIVANLYRRVSPPKPNAL